MSEAERIRTADYVKDARALQAVRDGLPLSVWAVAGPELVKEFDDVRADEDYPCRYALVRAILDWYHTGMTSPIPWQVAVELINNTYLQDPASGDDLTDALNWATRPIGIGGRWGRYSLLTLQHDGLTANDYVEDYERGHHQSPIPHATWLSAAGNTSYPEMLWNVGVRAFEAHQTAAAQNALQALAEAGDTDAMNNLGALLHNRDPVAAQSWYERAAAAGDATAMVNLAVLLQHRDPVTAQRWLERAAAIDTATDDLAEIGRVLGPGMTLYGYEPDLLWGPSDPAAEQIWYERAAAAGETSAMVNLGRLLEDRDPAAAQHWLERAAAAGDTLAMLYLGLLLEDRDPAAAQRWCELAAAAGASDEMAIMGALGGDDSVGAARRWLERAATAGYADAMVNLGLLLENRDPAAAQHWYERAAAAGNRDAMVKLAALLRDRDPTAAQDWLERAAARQTDR